MAIRAHATRMPWGIPATTRGTLKSGGMCYGFGGDSILVLVEGVSKHRYVDQGQQGADDQAADGDIGER